MPFADVNGLRVHYELHGHAGESLVLVHGYTGDVSNWDNQVDEFAGDYRVLILDNRGHGQSEAPADVEAYTVELMVDDTLAVIAVAGFEKYHLVGHSVGGAVAQEIALCHSDRLFSHTLNDTSHSFADHDQPGGTPPYVPPEHIKMGGNRIAGISKTASAGAWKGLLGWRGTTDRVHQIETPTLIVHHTAVRPSMLAWRVMLIEIPPTEGEPLRSLFDRFPGSRGTIDAILECTTSTPLGRRPHDTHAGDTVVLEGTG